jgi:hypothetical protein
MDMPRNPKTNKNLLFTLKDHNLPATEKPLLPDSQPANPNGKKTTPPLPLPLPPAEIACRFSGINPCHLP